MIEWTDEAMQQVISRLERQKSPGVRLALLGGGCAGFKYDFNYADGPRNDQDEELDFGKFKMWICPMSAGYLAGTVIGWRVEGLVEEFTFWNPAESQACGCGESVGF